MANKCKWQECFDLKDYGVFTINGREKSVGSSRKE